MAISWLKESIRMHQRDLDDFLDMVNRPLVMPSVFNDLVMGELEKESKKQEEAVSGR